MGKNIRNTTAKERMLKKIRQALLQRRDNPYPHFEDAPLYVEDATPLTVLFAEQFTAKGGQFVYCENELQLMESLLGLVEEKDLRRIHVWDTAIQEILKRYDFPYLGPEVPVMPVEEQPIAGISTCEALVAQEGTIMLSSAHASERGMNDEVQTHVVLAGVGQVIPDIKAAMEGMKHRYGMNQLPESIRFKSPESGEIYIFLLDY